MTQISPLLQNRLNLTSTKQGQTPNNRHEKLYQDLQKRAHEAKPNEPKAYLVEEGILGNPITEIKDTFNDGVNFFKTVHTGQIGDNNLGRINDLGLKLGAATIATFLAMHSKTKLEAVMQFVGGGSFIAAMSLWPKLFINLPARLVHGFRIDRKYISAQGDKKDFFLDNQFLVWDAYPEEQLRKDAKNAGIDYDAKNGKEKIQRKMQKTALQNRTLWMATAGFATPLMTSMFCDFVKPKINRAMINADVEKSKSVVQGGIKKYLDSVKSINRSEGTIKDLIGSYKGKELDKNFFEQLATSLSLNDIGDLFKHVDDTNPTIDLSSSQLVETLQKYYERTAVIKKKDFLDTITALQEASLKERKQALEKLAKEATGADAKAAINQSIEAMSGGNSLLDILSLATGGKVSPKQIVPVDNHGKEIENYAEELKRAFKALETSLGEEISIEKAREILKNNNYTSGQIESIIQKTVKNNDGFFDFIQKFNTEIASKIKGRAKAYLDIINPIVGSRAESRYTLDYEEAMKKIFNGLDVTSKDLKEFRGKSDIEVIKKLSEMFRTAVSETEGNEEKYKELIKRITLPKTDDKGLIDSIAALADSKNIQEILPSGKIGEIDATELSKAITGSTDDSKGLFELIRGFISKKNVDTEAIKSKAVICANFERRFLAGEFKGVLSDSELEIARKIVYDGTISSAKNRVEVKDGAIYKKIIDTLFDTSKYNEAEKEATPEIEKIIKNLAKIFKGEATGKTPTEDYLACGSASKLVRDFAVRLGNNKAWMKIFGTMSIALVAVTLLAQPFFGKIDKEFPEEKKGGTK